ncbi:MAG: hypothetical protein M1835_003191, partial [Candelina submexicana]
MSCVSLLALGTFNDWDAVGQWMSEQEGLEPGRDAASLHLLNLEVDNQVEESYFRILDNDKHVKYISIDVGIYNTEDLCFEPVLLSILPPFPPGPWNVGYIAKDDRGKPYFASTETKELPGIISTWHSVRVDYLTLHLGKSYPSHIFEASSPDFSST